MYNGSLTVCYSPGIICENIIDMKYSQILFKDLVIFAKNACYTIMYGKCLFIKGLIYNAKLSYVEFYGKNKCWDIAAAYKIDPEKYNTMREC